MTEKKQVTLTGNQIMHAFQNERAKIDALNNRQLVLQGKLAEILMARDSLKAIKKGQKGEKILINLGAGIYAQGLIDNQVNIKKSLTAPVVLDASIDDTLKELEDRKTKTTKQLEEIQRQQQAVRQNLEGLSKIISAASQARKQIKQEK